MQKYTTILFFTIGCQPQWVDLQETTVDTKNDTTSNDDESSQQDSNTSQDSDNLPSEEDENGQEPTEDGSGESSEGTNEGTNEGTTSPSEEPDEPEEVTFVGFYNGTFFGANEGFYYEEFCNGDLELEVTNNFMIVGSTICDSNQRGTWTYSFNGIGTQYGDELIISGEMTASSGYNSSFTTDLEGFAIIEANNTVAMNLEWEFPYYGIVGGAEVWKP